MPSSSSLLQPPTRLSKLSGVAGALSQEPWLKSEEASSRFLEFDKDLVTSHLAEEEEMECGA